MNNSDLALVEGKLGGWSKYNYPKSLSKVRPSVSPPPRLIGLQEQRADIELGVTACVEQLISVVSWVGILLGVSAIDSRAIGMVF